MRKDDSHINVFAKQENQESKQIHKGYFMANDEKNIKERSLDQSYTTDKERNVQNTFFLCGISNLICVKTCGRK